MDNWVMHPCASFHEFGKSNTVRATNKPPPNEQLDLHPSLCVSRPGPLQRENPTWQLAVWIRLLWVLAPFGGHSLVDSALGLLGAE